MLMRFLICDQNVAGVVYKVKNAIKSAFAEQSV